MLKRIFLAIFLLALCPGAAKSQCNVANFTDFEGGSAGNVVTSAIMTASTHGYSTGVWAVQEDNNPGNITLSANANQPLTKSTGVLCGNSTSYPAGAGSLGVQFTGVGVAGAHSITYSLPSQFQLPQLQAGIWFCSDLPASDTSIPDIMGIESSSSDFAGVNFDGNGLPNGRFFRLETVNGYSPTGIGGQPPIFVPTGNCPVFPSLGGDWLHLILTLGQVNVAPSTLVVYNTSGEIVGTIVVPASFIQNNGHATSTSIGCPANLTSSVTAGLHCFFDSWQVASTAVNLASIAAPLCIAASNAPADVQAALTQCLSGGSVILSRVSGTWNSQITGAITGAVGMYGQNQCTGGCAPGSQGVGLALTSNTTITTGISGHPTLTITGCSTANLFRLTGVTFLNTVDSGSTLNGAVNLQCVHGQASAARIDHLNITNQAGSFLVGSGGWGLVDHILYNDTSGAASFTGFNGDGASNGYLDWQNATNLGSGEAWIIEDSNFVSLHQPITDGNEGCKITIRHSQITGRGAGQVHGTDSGGHRSCVAVEIYNNTFTSNAIGFGVWNGSRGGTVLFHDNVLQGTAAWNGIELDYFRAALADAGVAQGWGLAQAGLNWTPATVGGTSNVLNPQASAYQTTHTYAARAVVNLAGCNVQTALGGTTGGSAPACPTFTNTVTDSGGVVWQNVGGGVAAPPGTTGTNAGFLTDNESTCSSGSCTRFFDTNGGVYPFRDQPCLIHGQVAFGCYQWNNTGARVPANWWNSDAPAAVQLNRDYFNATPAGYAPFTYPDPLQGTNPVVSVSPASESFGSVVVGASSGTQTATLSNPTAASITVTSITTTGNTSDFPNTGATTCTNGGTVAASGNCIVVTQFSPTSTGARSATLTIATSAGSFPVSLSGTGTSAVNPGVSISPAFIAFGNQSVGAPTPGTVVTITSTTSANLVMGTPPANISGTNAGDFNLQAVGGQCSNGQSIPQSSTCIERVVFLPKATGSRTAQLNIFDNVTGSPQIVTLSGTGVGTIAINPATLNYGLVAQGQTSASQLLTITNNTGVTLTLTGTSFSNTDFSSTSNTCNSGSLTNGSSCTANITFRPSATTGTNETGFFNVGYTGVGGSPVQTPLSGTVLPPIGTPATNIFASNLAGCGGPPRVATWCFTADRHIYISSCSGVPLVCGPYTPFTLMAQ